jgi:hypothetical protein
MRHHVAGANDKSGWHFSGLCFSGCMSFRELYGFPVACIVAISACSSTESGSSTSSSSSSSSSGIAGMGGAGGNGGMGGLGGNGGIAMDDAVLCMTLDGAAMPEPLVAGADVMSAPLLTAPDIVYDVTIPPAGGFVALQTATMHVTFAVYAGEVESFEVLLDGTPVVENVTEARCNGSTFRRYEHHSHDPSTFVIKLSPNPMNKSALFYHLL